MNSQCPKCGAPRTEEMKFCSSCGKSFQEEKKAPSNRDFLKEFLNYDPHIWRTIKLLISKPGQITKDYLNGNHEKLTSPAKLFIIISAIAFLFGSISLTDSNPKQDQPNQPLLEGTEKLPLQLEITTRSGLTIHNIAYYQPEIDSLGAEEFLNQRGNKPSGIMFWIVSRTIKKYQQNDFKEINVNHQRNASFLLYLLIPGFALFMKVFRWRRPMVEHFTFTLYFFSAFYLLQMISLLIGKLYFLIRIPFLGLLFIPLSLIYLIMALRRNYAFNWGISSLLGLVTGALLLVSAALLLFFSSLLILAL